MLFSKKISSIQQRICNWAVSLDSTLVDVHPDVPKEYVEKKLSDLKFIVWKYKLYRGDREPVAVKNKNIILVDDGIATGNTLCESRNATKASTCKIIVAVPVLPYDTLAVFEKILNLCI
jgi:predicted phosphoribosyltransferase